MIPMRGAGRDRQMTVGDDYEEFDQALRCSHDALNRMRRAAERGTGCHLTAEMIQSLSLTIVGSMWAEGDPRHD